MIYAEKKIEEWAFLIFSLQVYLYTKKGPLKWAKGHGKKTIIIIKVQDDE